MKSSLLVIATLGLGLGLAAPAFGQTVPVTPDPTPTASPSTEIERLPSPRSPRSEVRPGGDALPPPGVAPGDQAEAGPRQFAPLKPGAMMFASFDANKDGILTKDEVAAGAAVAFKAADANADGSVGGFEQQDWAAIVDKKEGILANQLLFDSDLDHKVTEREFVAGLQRLAGDIGNIQAGIPVASLTTPEPLGPPDERAGRVRVDAGAPQQRVNGLR